MLEDLRRAMAHRREEKRKEKLKGIEVGRRLSAIQTKRYEERKAAEEEFRTQRREEIGALTEASQALAERKRTEKELRRLTPGLGRRMAKVAKGALYDVPVKTARALSRPGAGEALRKAIVGDPSLFLGRGEPKKPVERKPGQPTVTKPTQSVSEFLYGKPSEAKEKDSAKDILS